MKHIESGRDPLSLIAGCSTQVTEKSFCNVFFYASLSVSRAGKPLFAGWRDPVLLP
jgi:hypothetical protein